MPATGVWFWDTPRTGQGSGRVSSRKAFPSKTWRFRCVDPRPVNKGDEGYPTEQPARLRIHGRVKARSHAFTRESGSWVYVKAQHESAAAGGWLVLIDLVGEPRLHHAQRMAPSRLGLDGGSDRGPRRGPRAPRGSSARTVATSRIGSSEGPGSRLRAQRIGVMHGDVGPPRRPAAVLVEHDLAVRGQLDRQERSRHGPAAASTG